MMLGLDPSGKGSPVMALARLRMAYDWLVRVEAK